MRKLILNMLILLFLVSPVYGQPTASYDNAADIVTDTSEFQGKLSPADITVQRALDTLDDLLGAGDAADITYDNATYPTVESALNNILYNAPTITSFTNDQNSVENGSTITSTQLDWTISGTITSQSINQGVGSIATGLRTKTHSSSYSTNRTYTLTISDGTTTTTRNTTITFLNSNYYGVSANTSLTSGQVNALSNALASGRTQTRTITATSQYIYIAYPAAYGAATFTVNGLTNNDWTLSTQSHTNASGAMVSYNVYRTNNLLTGTYTIEVN